MAPAADIAISLCQLAAACRPASLTSALRGQKRRRADRADFRNPLGPRLRHRRAAAPVFPGPDILAGGAACRRAHAATSTAAKALVAEFQSTNYARAGLDHSRSSRISKNGQKLEFSKFSNGSFEGRKALSAGDFWPLLCWVFR
jgi:hypothetical protein